jgi:hypothetical protein
MNSIGANPDSPDGLTFGQPRAPISVDISNSYTGLGSRVVTDAKGERRNPQFRQRFHGLRVCRPDPNGESGLILLCHMTSQIIDLLGFSQSICKPELLNKINNLANIMT